MAVSFASAPPEVKKKRLMSDTSAARAARRARSPAGSSSRVARRVGQRLHLLARGVGKLAAAVTKDDVPEAGKAVDVLLAVGIDEHRAVAADPHTAGSLNGGIVLRMNQRRQVAGEQIVQSAVIVSTRARFFEQCAAPP